MKRLIISAVLGFLAFSVYFAIAKTSQSFLLGTFGALLIVGISLIFFRREGKPRAGSD